MEGIYQTYPAVLAGWKSNTSSFSKSTVLHLIISDMCGKLGCCSMLPVISLQVQFTVVGFVMLSFRYAPLSQIGGQFVQNEKNSDLLLFRQQLFSSSAMIEHMYNQRLPGNGLEFGKVKGVSIIHVELILYFIILFSLLNKYCDVYGGR